MVGAFLAFIERDTMENPSRIRPLSETMIERGVELMARIKVFG
jgi:hypothetical protein